MTIENQSIINLHYNFLNCCMDPQIFPNPTRMTILATLKEKCNPKELFETLPINDKIH